MALTERIRRELDRWPYAADVALSVVAFLASVLVWARNGSDSSLRTFGEVPLPAYLVFAVAALALLARKRHPVLVFAVVLICSAVAVTFDYGHVGVASLVSLYAVGRYCSGFWANAGVLGAAPSPRCRTRRPAYQRRNVTRTPPPASATVALAVRASTSANASAAPRTPALAQNPEQ